MFLPRSGHTLWPGAWEMLGGSSQGWDLGHGNPLVLFTPKIAVKGWEFSGSSTTKMCHFDQFWSILIHHQLEPPTSTNENRCGMIERMWHVPKLLQHAALRSHAGSMDLWMEAASGERLKRSDTFHLTSLLMDPGWSRSNDMCEFLNCDVSKPAVHVLVLST